MRMAQPNWSFHFEGTDNGAHHEIRDSPPAIEDFMARVQDKERVPIGRGDGLATEMDHKISCVGPQPFAGRLQRAFLGASQEGCDLVSVFRPYALDEGSFFGGEIVNDKRPVARLDEFEVASQPIAIKRY